MLHAPVSGAAPAASLALAPDAPPAAAILAVVKAGLTSWQGQLAGQIGLLVAVIVVIRILPRGLTGFILRERT